jgi:hypothetical protein
MTKDFSPSHFNHLLLPAWASKHLTSFL